MFVGRIVVEDDVDSLLHWNRFLDGVEEADELLMAMALHTPTDHLTFEHVVGRKESGATVTLVIMVMVAARPFFIGRPGWVRSSAWIWLFSSTDRTTAWAGGST